MSNRQQFWSLFTLFVLGIIFAIALDGWQYYARMPRDESRAKADACVAKNQTWRPVYDMFGAMRDIRCNPDIPYIEPIRVDSEVK